MSVPDAGIAALLDRVSVSQPGTSPSGMAGDRMGSIEGAEVRVKRILHQGVFAGLMSANTLEP
jgi:hypothetical protein